MILSLSLVAFQMALCLSQREGVHVVDERLFWKTSVPRSWHLSCRSWWFTLSQWKITCQKKPQGQPGTLLSKKQRSHTSQSTTFILPMLNRQTTSWRIQLQNPASPQLPLGRCPCCTPKREKSERAHLQGERMGLNASCKAKFPGGDNLSFPLLYSTAAPVKDTHPARGLKTPFSLRLDFLANATARRTSVAFPLCLKSLSAMAAAV